MPVPIVDDIAMPKTLSSVVDILIVDDDARNLAALEATLDSPEYRLVQAQTADDALRAIMTHDFALLILDVRMPEISGLELAKMIKQRKKSRHIPIIFLTAYYPEDEYALQGYGAGAVDYIAKPFNAAVLRSKVAVFAELYRTNRALHEEIVARTATEQQLAERTLEVQQMVGQLRALALELTRAEQRERRRLARVLHDHMQQLLVSVKMQLFVVQQDPESSRNTDILKSIQSAVEEAISVSRTVTIELSPPVLDQAGFVPALEWLAARLKEKHQFTVSIHVDGYTEPADFEERLLLFECTRELLFNAFKHSGRTDVDVYLSLTGDNRIRIVVQDKGIGFDKNRLSAHVASPTSFGLFSVQQRLTHLGGELQIVTEPGAGTSISILAPQPGAASPNTEAGPARRIATPAKPTLGSKPIQLLIVDDHTIVRESLANMLRAETGIQILGEAGSRTEAIRLADELKPDVILMDVNLGPDSGLETTRSILSKNPEIKIIGLSMYNEDEIAAAMRAVGAVGYVTKSAAAQELVSVIRSV